MRRFAWASTLAVLGFFAGCAAAPRAAVDITESIRPIPLFSGLSETELDRVAGICSVRECPAGTPLIRQGSQDDRLYVIHEGKAEVRVNGRAIATLENDAVAGEMSFVDNRPASADVAMSTNGKLIEIKKAELQQLMDSQPHLGLTIMGNIARILSEKLRAMNPSK